MTQWLVVSYLAAGGCLIDQLRRAPSDWVAADRSRGWWITVTVVLGFFACGVLIAAAYLIGVVPRLGRSHAIDESFRRRR